MYTFQSKISIHVRASFEHRLVIDCGTIDLLLFGCCLTGGAEGALVSLRPSFFPARIGVNGSRVRPTLRPPIIIISKDIIIGGLCVG